MPFDAALRIEARYFAHVMQTREAAAMIRSLFISMQELNKLARRPAAVPQAPIRKIAIIGAGFMGAGIAQVERPRRHRRRAARSRPGKRREGQGDRRGGLCQAASRAAA